MVEKIHSSHNYAIEVINTHDGSAISEVGSTLDDIIHKMNIILLDENTEIDVDGNTSITLKNDEGILVASLVRVITDESGNIYIKHLHVNYEELGE